MKTSSRLAAIIKSHEKELLGEWVKAQLASSTLRGDLLNEHDLREQSRNFLAGVQSAAQKGELEDIDSPAWAEVKRALEELSRSRALAGFSPSETAMFVFSLKQPLFARLRGEVKDAETLAQELWSATLLLDKLGLYTTEVFQKSREQVIERQGRELLELSTPVVELWDDILALPLVGTLDSERTQIVMESLLQKIVSTGLDRHHRHHRRAHSRHAGGAAPAEDRLRHPPDGRRLHHQRHPPADRADHRAPGRQPRRGDHQGDAGRRLPGGAEAHRVDDPAAEGRVEARQWRRRPQEQRRRRSGACLMERIPILKMGHFLLVTIQVDMHDKLAMTLQDDLTQRISKERSKGVLLDISALDVVDSFIGRMIANISSMARVLDAETVVVGMQPAVAITLVELGLPLEGVFTALNVEKGMALLHRRLEADV
jgi:anti-anti-sigma regulatory factor